MSVEIRFRGRVVPVAAGQTVLTALEDAGLTVSSSCRAGVCQACVMRVVDGPIPARAQEGLKESLKESGHFLACVARPETSLSCESADVAAFRGEVRIKGVTVLAPGIARVRFARPPGFDFASGQFVTLRQGDVVRSYSIASRASEAHFFDVHVRHVPGGRMSGWFHTNARPDAELWMEGPKGDCVYRADTLDEPLILAGTGTGMAPLVSIIDAAVGHGHRGPIVLIRTTSPDGSNYLEAEIAELARRAPNVSCVRTADHLSDFVVANAPRSLAPRLYLCGSPRFVGEVKKRLFLAGHSLRRIHSDPFIGTDP